MHERGRGDQDDPGGDRPDDRLGPLAGRGEGEEHNDDLRRLHGAHREPAREREARVRSRRDRRTGPRSTLPPIGPQGAAEEEDPEAEEQDRRAPAQDPYWQREDRRTGDEGQASDGRQPDHRAEGAVPQRPGLRAEREDEDHYLGQLEDRQGEREEDRPDDRGDHGPASAELTPALAGPAP